MSRSITRPAPGAPRPYAFPQAERVAFANGVTLYVVALRRLPVVTTLFMTDAGAERDAPGKDGVGALTAAALAEGTSHQTADELADAFERLGGALDIDGVWTRAECSTTVLAPRFDRALDLLSEVIRAPSFPDAGVDRLRAERLAELLQQRTEPRGLADDRFAGFVFDTRSRYARAEEGDETGVEGLVRDDVVQHHRRHFTPARSALIVVGDVDVDHVLRRGEAILGDWNGMPSPPGDVAVAPAHADRHVHIVHKSDAPQSELRVGHMSVLRNHPDFYRITAMNAILGGLFNSRVNLNLRERNAYTYGAFSSFDWRRHASVFEVSTAVRSDVTAAAVQEILGEIDRIREERVTERELSLAIDYLTGVFPIRFETTAAIASALATREGFGLEPGYFDTYRERIAAVTADDVRDVAQRHLQPEQLQIVAVGDAPAIRPGLEGLKLGTVATYDPTGTAI